MKTIRLLLYCLLFFACNVSENHSKKKITSQKNASNFDRLEERLDSLKNEVVMPGFGVVIVHGDSMVYAKGFGDADIEKRILFTPKTIHVMASVSKTFIGVALVKLMELEGIRLDTPINKLLPFEVRHPHFPKSTITLRQLANHTAGLREDFDPETVGESDVLLLEDIEFKHDSIFEKVRSDMRYYSLGKPTTLRQNVFNFLHPEGKWYSEANYRKVPPGTNYEYSNLNADLAAYIIEYQSGMSFSEFTKKYIFDPLAMTQTSWFYLPKSELPYSSLYRPDDWDQPTYAIKLPKFRYAGYSSGDLKSTLVDMSKYLKEMLKGANGQGTLLTKEGYKTLFSPQLNASHFSKQRDDSPLSDEYNSGIFWAVSPTGIRLHNGGSIGVFSFLYMDPTSNSGAFGFSNLSDSKFEFVRDYVFEAERNYIK